MKIIKILILLFVASFSETTQGKEKPFCNASCLYSTASAHIDLTAVDRSDDATVIRFRMHCTPGEKFCIPKGLYLSDSQDRRYMLMRTEGVEPGKPVTFPLADFMEFSLSFDPLPKNEHVFDLLSADETFRWFAFWGISEKMKSKMLRKIEDHEPPCTDSTLVRPGVAYVKGRFIGQQHPDSLYLTIPFTGRKAPNPYIRVGKDGTFEAKRELPGKSWTYLDNKKVRLPLFLTPDDTLSLLVYDYGTPQMHICYESARGYDTHGDLMRADPLYTNAVRYSILPNTSMRPCELREIAAEMKEQEHRFWQYLVWKYHLDSVDAHLLNLYMQSRQIDFLNSCANQTVLNAMSLGSLITEGKEEFGQLESDAIVNSYWFLQAIDTHDLSIFSIPYQYSVQAVCNNYPAQIVRQAKGKQAAISLFEKILRKPLSNLWITIFELENGL